MGVNNTLLTINFTNKQLEVLVVAMKDDAERLKSQQRKTRESERSWM